MERKNYIKKKNLAKNKGKEEKLPLLSIACVIVYLIAMVARTVPGYDRWIGMPREWIRSK